VLRKLSLVFLLSLSLLPFFLGTAQSLESTHNVSSSLLTLYGKATHLLGALSSKPPEEDEAEARVRQENTVKAILALSGALAREEQKLDHLLGVRAAIKHQTWTWFLDPHIRSQVDEVSLQINNQRRAVEALFDDISLHWRQLKPLYGVRSRVFLAELAVFLLSPIITLIELSATAFSFGLLFFLLLLGPVAWFFGMFALSLGIALLPVLGGALLVLWTLELPWMVIQYNPSLLEFFAVYAPFLLANYWLATRVKKTVSPRYGETLSVQSGAALNNTLERRRTKAD